MSCFSLVLKQGFLLEEVVVKGIQPGFVSAQAENRAHPIGRSG